jgi:hypothetical protein
MQLINRQEKMYTLHWISKLDSQEKTQYFTCERSANIELILLLDQAFKAWLIKEYL